MTELDDWQILLGLFPSEWRQLGRSSGAVRRLRGFPSLDAMLRTLLLHVGCGWSLRETSVQAKLAGIADVSDVTLLNRLRDAENWLRLMCQELWKENGVELQPSFGGRMVRLVDATVVREPGKTGSQWRIHYSFQWPTLACDYFKVTATEGKGTGETLRHFPLNPQDHILVDRGYCHASGIHYVASKSAFVTVRLNPDGIILHSTDGAKFGLLEQLKSIKKAGQTGEWKILIPFENQPPVPVRLCVIRKSQTAIALAHKKLRRYASKHHTRLQPETLLYAQYVMVLTTFPRKEFSLQQILQSYRFRWQIELIFKRFKQIAQLGHLPKYDEDSSLAWLYGKLFVALLTEKLIQHAGSISPWGYSLALTAESQPLA